MSNINKLNLYSQAVTGQNSPAVGVEMSLGLKYHQGCGFEGLKLMSTHDCMLDGNLLGEHGEGKLGGAFGGSGKKRGRVDHIAQFL